MRLAGKVAIVSGGGTGIGAATVRRFAAEGARLVITGRRAEPLRSLADEIGCVAVPGDMADTAHADAATASAVQAFGGLDIVVANHGASSGGTPGGMTDEAWRTSIEANLTGSLHLVRAAIPPLRARGGGSIVLVSSVAGLVAFPGSADYTVTKTALIGLARSIAVDHAADGIRANVVCPGWVRTPMADEAMDRLAAERGSDRDDAYASATRFIPARREATPEEIAACILFLASDESSYVNAGVLTADGGSQALDVGLVDFLEGTER